MSSSNGNNFGSYTKTRVSPADLPVPNNGRTGPSRVHKVIVVYGCNHIASSFNRACPGGTDCPCDKDLRAGHRSPIPCNECRWINYAHAVEDKLCVIRHFRDQRGNYIGFRHDYCGAHDVHQVCSKPLVEVWETNPGWKKHALCAMMDFATDTEATDTGVKGEEVDVLEPLTKLRELSLGKTCRCGFKLSEESEDPRCTCNRRQAE